MKTTLIKIGKITLWIAAWIIVTLGLAATFGTI